MNKIVTIILLFLAINVQGKESLHMNYLTPDKGLRHQHVRAILQDNNGFIWLGATDGLCRYDGYAWLEFTPGNDGHEQLLLDNRVQHLEQWMNRFILIRQRGRSYSCYDQQLRQFVDYSGDGTYQEAYQRTKTLPDSSLWLFGKEGGRVVRFDGKRFSYQRLGKQNGTLASDNITLVEAGQGGTTWIATDGGLYSYRSGKTTLVSKKTNFVAKCTLHQHEYFITSDGNIFTVQGGKALKQVFSPYPALQAMGKVKSMAAVGDRLLIATDGDTYTFTPSTGMLAPSTIGDKNVFITTDTRGNTVIYTVRGHLWFIEKGKAEMRRLPDVYDDTLLRLNESPQYNFVTDRWGTLWVSTYGNGVFAIDTKDGSARHFLAGRDRNAVLQSNYIASLYEDRAGTIWIGQEDSGLLIVSRSDNDSQYTYFTDEERTDHSNNIRMVKRMPNNDIYIANKQNGVRIADGNLQHLRDMNRYNDDLVALCSDLDGNLWAGTRKSGVFVNDRNYHHDNANTKSLSNGKVSEIICDRKGRVWIAMFNDGLNLAVKQTDGSYTFNHYFEGKHAVTQPRLLMEDHHGYIWLCTSEGAYIFNPDELIKKPAAYQRLNINGQGYNNDELRYIIEDRHHHVWVSTLGFGVTVLDNKQAGKPEVTGRYNTKNGLPNDNVMSIIEDRNGNIWMGTDHGLAMFDYKEQEIRNYFPSDEQPMGNRFEEKSVCMLSDGRLAFGTKHGILTFNPNNFVPRVPQFRLSVTNILVNGNTLAGPENAEVREELLTKKRLNVAHDENSLTFYFSDFDFTAEKGSRYTYYLEGYEEEWSELSTFNFATYKNLPSGNYTLHVKAQSVNGVWNPDEIVLDVKVRAPWWATWWASLLYLLIAALIALSVYTRIKRENELRNKVKVEEQLTEYKIRFFTNVSHEFRTPLTIIKGAMDNIVAQNAIPGDMKQPLASMKKSADRLQRMVNQLLEFSKMHSGKLSLSVEEGDIVAFVQDIFHSFREIAENKHINYQFATMAKSERLWFDRDHVDKIVYNLVSNAFKYTPSGGEIIVRVGKEDDRVTISVSDTGIGFTKDKQEKLFTRFDQSAFSHDSIGIGLHLTNELVHVHHGTITFQENTPKGSIFTVGLPTDKSVYREEDIKAQVAGMPLEEVERKSVSPLDNYRSMAPKAINDKTVMVVDDDPDVLEFIKGELQPYFVITTASDGKEALEILLNEEQPLPDLIVTDAKMPVMNGYELTQRLRKESRTADIPIVMVTAMTDEQQKVKGLHAGVDAYVEKPFSTKVLVARCSQLLQQRDKMKIKYAKEVVSKPALPEILVEEKDRKFQEILDTWVTGHISDSSLSVETLAEKMGYGRTSFFKKVKQVTGMTPNEYLKKHRMERAAELLREDNITAQQVSYAVGIDDPQYFSKIFKSYYGVTPSKYKKGV